MSFIDRARAADETIQRLVVSDDAQREIRHALERFAPLLDPTPRAMKRFVMTYSMLLAVRTAELAPVSVGPLALWTVVVTRWPLLAEYLQNTPSAVDCFRIDRDRLPASTPPQLVPLFCDPPPALRAVMNHRAGPLDAQTIRACTGQALARSPARSA